MGAPSPRYTVEFKQKAVELYRKSGTTYAEVARGLDQLDPPDVEGVLVLRSIREKCAGRIEDAARILEAAGRGLLCRGARACSQRRPLKRNAPLSAGKPSRCPLRLFDSGRRPELGRP